MVWGCHFQSLSEAASFSSKKNELFHGMIYKQFICSLVDENLDCSQLGAIMNKDVIKILGLKKKKRKRSNIFLRLWISLALFCHPCLLLPLKTIHEHVGGTQSKLSVEPFHPQKPHPTGWKTWVPSSFHTLYNL